ncbi:MAG: hypothetical protein ACXVPL_07415 [Actinomycetota bacterium]
MSESEFPTQPGRDPSLPPPPVSSPADPWGALRPSDAWASAPPEEPSKRRRPAVVIAAVVALALVAGIGTFAVLRKSAPTASGPATALALAFDRGDQTTYDLHMKMDGSIDLGSAGSQPLSMDTTESVGWKVLKVAKDGTATVRMSVNGASGSVNGQPIPAGAAESSTTLRVTPDGQIIDANGMSLGSVGASPMGSFPGMNQVTPILPDHAVSPGDEWDKHFSQKFPFGDAKIEYTAHSTFERYEQIDGVRAAVITTEYMVPLDFSLDLGELAKAFGGTGDATGLSGKNGTMTYGGSGTFTQTSWLDLEQKQIVKGTTDGKFDMTMSLPALAAQLGTDHVSMSATFSLEMTRR